MVAIDERCVGRLGLGDRAAHSIHAAAVHRHRDHHEVLVFQLIVKLLPHGQIKTAASPGGPTRQKDFFAAVIRKTVRFAVDVGQGEVRRLK